MLFAKKKIWWKFSKSNFVLGLVLDQKFSKSKIFLKRNFFFFDNFSIKHDILRLFAKKKKILVKIF